MVLLFTDTANHFHVSPLILAIASQLTALHCFCNEISHIFSIKALIFLMFWVLNMRNLIIFFFSSLFFPLIFNLLVLYYLVACDCKTKPGQKKSDKTTEWVKITSFLLNYGNQSSQNKLCLQAMKEWGIGQNHFAVQWFQRIHCTPWTLVRICLLMDPQTKIHTQREREREKQWSQSQRTQKEWRTLK